MKKMNFKKIATMGLAAMMAMSAMSVSAFAAYDSVDEFGFGLASGFTVGDDGAYELLYPENVPFGSSTKPYGPYYIYTTNNNTSSSEYLINEMALFEFDFADTCTTNTKQYAEFIIGADEGTIVQFTARGTSLEESPSYIDITLVPVGTASEVSFEETEIMTGSSTRFTTTEMDDQKFYYVLVTPSADSAGKEMHGTISVTKY